jgi:hypothetical protein
MVYQTNSNALIAYKKQAGLGTPASGAAASVLRLSGGNGIKLAKAAIASAEVRNDGMSTRGRHGTQAITAAYNAELSLGSHDGIIEALMRSTWDSATLTKSQTDFTSLTTGANTVILATGNPITMGFRVFDVIRLGTLNATANNNRNLRITGLSATTITVAETLTVDAVADTSCTITRSGKRLINPAVLVKPYFTLEEYEGDIDQSTTVQDFVWGGLKFSMANNGLVMAAPSGVGIGQVSALATGAPSPYFTSPVATTDVPMSVVDATIRLAGNDLVQLTALDINLDIQPASPPVFGSGTQKFGADVFTGPLLVSMNLTMLRKDLSIFSDFIAETQYSLHLLAVDNMAEPKDFVAITVPNFTLGSTDPSALSKQGGGRTQSIAIPAGLVGVDTSATGDNSMIKFQTTAP